MAYRRIVPGRNGSINTLRRDRAMSPGSHAYLRTGEHVLHVGKELRVCREHLPDLQPQGRHRIRVRLAGYHVLQSLGQFAAIPPVAEDSLHNASA